MPSRPAARGRSRKRGTVDGRNWERLAEQLRLRRARLSPHFANRGVFAEATDINYKLVSDLETAYRTNYGVDQLLKAAAAYQVTYESIGDVLDHDGDLVPADPAGVSPERLAPEGKGADAEPHLPVLYNVDEEHLSRYLVDVQQLVLAAVRRTGSSDPAPGDIFEDPDEAEAWRRGAEDLAGEPLLSPDERIRLIAIRRMNRAASRRAG